jgi:hypothetical protein
MSAAEFGRWCEYFNKYGRVTPVRMFDSGPALLAWKVDHVMGGKTEIRDYLPFQTEHERVATVEDVFAEFGGVKRRG